MAVMNSLAVWAAAAGEARLGVEWRDAVTARMSTAPSYLPYEELVGDAAAEVRLDPDAPARLFAVWARIEPWPDAQAIARLALPYAFVTNCSARLAAIAATRSGLAPRFTLTAEDAGLFKPRPEVYDLACRRLGTTPNRAVLVAGSPYDAAGGRQAGLQAVLIVRRADQRSADHDIPTMSSLWEVVDRLGPGATKS